MCELRLAGISKRYDDQPRPALNHLDLTVPSGEFVVLVGPSGCGKSTTLRIIAGLEESSTGKVFIGERDVTNLAPAKRDIAMVFQSYALYPHMSVYDNIAFALKLRKMSGDDIRARVEATAASLGIEELLDRKPKALSGGQRQRVAIGRAIVRDPKVFLFDEPLSNLDAKLRNEMRREIARIHSRSNTTSVYVTHDQIEAMTLADRIVVLRDGELQQVGSPMELYDRPGNRFVAGFFGTPSMNFFTATVDGEGAKGSGFDIWSLPVTPQSGEVILGIRPEAMTLEPIADTTSIDAAVELREVLGAEVVLHMSSAAGPLTVRTDAHSPAREGDNLTVWLDHNQLHVFDGASELRL